MPFTLSGKNTILAAFDATHIGLHTAYPGDSGASETSGGSPAYARKAATWAAASGGERALSASVTGFDVAAGVTIKWATAWTALTSGSARANSPIGTTLHGVGTVQASDDLIRSDAHGLVASRRVVFYPAEGEALPTGITEGTDYFVLASGLTADVFSISATDGGSAINFTTDGEMHWQDMVPVTDAAQFKVDVTTFVAGLNG